MIIGAMMFDILYGARNFHTTNVQPPLPCDPPPVVVPVPMLERASPEGATGLTRSGSGAMAAGAGGR
jgi:hypothetical protein